MKKLNGFNQRPHPYQVTSYTYFLCMILSYFLIVMPLSSTASKVVGAILESLSGVILLVSGYLVTAIDPSDTFLKKSREAQFTQTPYNAPIQDFYCTADKSYVLATSKHCKRCNRCTEGFDHHCKWVNNDVGKANYKHFIVMISSATVFLLVYLACAIALTVQYANDNLLLDNDIYLYTEKGNILGGMVIMWILMVISAIFSLLIINLLFFHIYLIFKGMTTYEYIIASDFKKASQQENAKKNKAPIKRTCLDFVLCLKKKKVAQVNFTLNENAQKSVAKELVPDNSASAESKQRKASELSKKDETRNALDNTQNEDNFEMGESKEKRLTSPGHSKSPQTIMEKRVFTFEKNIEMTNKGQNNQGERTSKLVLTDLESNKISGLLGHDDHNIKTALGTPHREEDPLKLDVDSHRPGNLVMAAQNNYLQNMTPAFGEKKTFDNVRSSNYNQLGQNSNENFRRPSNAERTSKYEV